MDRGELGREYRDGEAICHQGEVGNRMYVIQSGCVEVLREENGTEVLVAELGGGDVFGEMAIFDRKPRSATVRSKGTARVLTLDKRAFLRGVHEDPSLAFRVLQEMSQRIRSLDEEVSRLKYTIATEPSTNREIKYVVIVPRTQPDLYGRLARDLSPHGDVQVLLDRRDGESRRERVMEPPGVERRMAERRGHAPVAIVSAPSTP